METTTAVVLAAGEGTRLRPLTEYRPKPMLPAANRPILERVLDALVEAGVTDLHVVVGYRGDRVQNHFGPTFQGTPLHYHHQEKVVGTGHAVLQAADAISGDFLVVNGDEVLHSATVERLRAAHAEGDADATLAVVEREDAPQYGAVRLSGNRITELVEKPGTGKYRFLNAGVYAFDDGIFEAIRETPRSEGELRLTDTIAQLIDDEKLVRGVRTDAPMVTATYPWDLLRVARHLLDGREFEPDPGGQRIQVADSAQVDDEAVLRAPVSVSEDCEVGPGAVVGPYTALGRNVTVEGGAVVAGSVVDSDTRVGHNATVLDCVTGQSVHIGAGATAPGGPADVQVGDRLYEDKRLGALLADRASVGGGATLVPGTLVGSEASVGVGVTIDGVVEHGAEVVR